MPNVPTYQRQLSIPGKTSSALADDSSVTEIGRQQSGLSKELLGLSGDILRIRRQMKEQQDETTALNISTSIDDDYRTFLTSELAKTGQDSYNAMDRANEFIKSSSDKYTKDYQDNRRVTGLVNNYVVKKSKTLKDKLALHELDQRREATNTAISLKSQGLLKDVYSGSYTPVEAIEIFTESISRMHDTGALGRDEAAEFIIQGNQKIAEAHLDGVISRDPEKALELIKSGAYNNYLQQEKIEEYDKKAKTIASSMNKVTEAEAKKAEKAAADNAYKSIQSLLMNGKYLEAKNAWFDNMNVMEDSQVNTLRENIEQGINLDLKEAKEGATKTDDVTFNNLYSDIRENKAGYDDVLRARNSGLLSKEDFKFLDSKVKENEKQPALNPYKTTINFAKSKIITQANPLSMFGDSMKPEENQRFYQFIHDFENVVAEKKIPKTDGKALWEEMQTMLPNYIQTFAEREASGIEKMKQDQKALVEELRKMREGGENKIKAKPAGKKETGTLPEGLTETTIEYNMKKYGKTREEVIQKWKSRGK